LVLAVLAAMLALAQTAGAAGAQREENRKPSVALRLNPPVGFTPLRVRVEVELRGGADDYQEFYCPSIEWDWADGTVSETGDDCQPYEAGKSRIQRRYTATYTFRQSGNYKVYFRMKQRGKVVGATSANVQVRPGLRGDFDDR
jgi:hypothetical protein